ncbi:MAG: PEP-CTERM sorting domain-containing protein [Phycisphaerae bacterium]|nr:PEP-CTERM sorting domain-containing protein [Phycisphaerae bacterium]
MRILSAGLLLTCLTGAANAAIVGRPVSLDITITQGGSTIVDAMNVVIPGTDILDGTNYIAIGDIGGLSTAYLSVWMQDETADESLMSFYVRAGDPSSALTPGTLPLFDLTGSGMIDVHISNLQFEVGGTANNVNVAEFGSPIGDYMSAMYMMNSSGWYYELPGVEPVVIGSKLTHQVPYSDFKDGDSSHYQFDDGSGTNVDVAWRNIYSPVDTDYVIIQSDSPYASMMDASGGAVFEMGLSAFAWGNGQVPEPGTVGLLMLGGMAFLRRRHA